MIHHIIMIKLKSFWRKDDKIEKAEEIKAALETLPAKIKEIQFFEVGVNINESERSSDIVLISKFRNVEDLNRYCINPFHQSVARIIKEYSTNVSYIDYQTLS